MSQNQSGGKMVTRAENTPTNEIVDEWTLQ